MSYPSPALFIPSPTDFVYKPCTSSFHNLDLNFEAHRLKLFSHLHESSRDSDVLNLPLDVDDATRETSSTEPAFRPSLNRLGNYRLVKRRYYHWIKMGVLNEMLSALACEADLKWLMIDSTIVWAHQHAAGAHCSKERQMPRAWVGHAGD